MQDTTYIYHDHRTLFIENKHLMGYYYPIDTPMTYT